MSCLVLFNFIFNVVFIFDHVEIMFGFNFIRGYNIDVPKKKGGYDITLIQLYKMIVKFFG